MVPWYVTRLCCIMTIADRAPYKISSKSYRSLELSSRRKQLVGSCVRLLCPISTASTPYRTSDSRVPCLLADYGRFGRSSSFIHEMEGGGRFCRCCSLVRLVGRKRCGFTTRLAVSCFVFCSRCCYFFHVAMRRPRATQLQLVH